MTQFLTLQNAPIEKVTVDDHSVFVKRDDLLHRDFSGNKARKLFYLLEKDLSGVDKLVSYGSAQSNAMYSLSALAKMRGIGFDYYVAHLPSWLKDNPAGNYKGALANGVKIIDVAGQLLPEQTLEAYVESAILSNQTQSLYVPEGGRYQDAAAGVYRLADEIADWARQAGFERLNVMLPSGTGTTALFIKKRFVELGLPFEVLTCACVGGDDYLKKQFLQLSERHEHHPTILNCGKKYHFGKLYQSFYQIWLKLKAQTAIEFDLLYDPLGWQVTCEFLQQHNDGIPLIYIHQGGLLGNETMLARYQRKYGH